MRLKRCRIMTEKRECEQPACKWHIWFCPTLKADPSQNQKSQISNRTIKSAIYFLIFVNT